MRSKLLLFAVLFFVSGTCPAQLFTRITPQEAQGAYGGEAAWLDFDNDGDLDFLLTGASDINVMRTVFYENTGNNMFRKALAPFNNFDLPQYGECEIDFINVNGDDRIDVLLMGRRIGIENTNRISLVENLGTELKESNPFSAFGRADGFGAVSIGDINNDAASDVFLSGITGYANGSALLSARLFINNKNGTYTMNTASPFTPLYFASSQFADMDNDGDLDLIVAGIETAFSSQQTLLYINNGDGDFALSPAQFKKLQHPSIDIADFDGDHDLDLLLNGQDKFFDYHPTLYSNAEGVFTEISLPLSKNRTSGSARWGDYDNDGDQDIVFAGYTGKEGAKNMGIFQNNGGQFIEITDISFESLSQGYASWGDYDNDGDLDIIFTGTNSSSLPTLRVLRSEVADKNTKPGAPANFQVTPINTNSCMLTWDQANDDHTPVSSLTYNISVRNFYTGKYLQYPFSADGSGERKVSEPGNVWLNTAWKLNLDNGTYILKVQAIDGAFAGSPWGETQKFYAGTPSSPASLVAEYADGKINLSWEDNADNEEFFVIERSVNNGAFIEIDKVTSDITAYSDALPPEGLYEYRVYAKNPGSYSDNSNVASILITGVESFASSGIHIYPSPAASKSVKVNIRSYGDDVASASFIDAQGVIQQTVQLQFDNNGEAEADISALPAGLYLVKVTMGTCCVRMLRFIKV